MKQRHGLFGLHMGCQVLLKRVVPVCCIAGGAGIEAALQANGGFLGSAGVATAGTPVGEEKMKQVLPHGKWRLRGG